MSDIVWAKRNIAMYTVQNCLLYPILEYSAAQNLLHEERPGLLEKYGIALNTSNSVQTTKPPQRGNWPAIGHCRLEMCHQLFPGANREKCQTNPHDIGYFTRHEIGPVNDPWYPQW